LLHWGGSDFAVGFSGGGEERKDQPFANPIVPKYYMGRLSIWDATFEEVSQVKGGKEG